MDRWTDIGVDEDAMKAHPMLGGVALKRRGDGLGGASLPFVGELE